MLPLKAQNGWHHCSRCKCCLHCLLCWAFLCWHKSHVVGNVGPSHRLLTMVALGNKHKAILCCVCFPWHTHFFAMPLPLLSTLALLPILHVESGSCTFVTRRNAVFSSLSASPVFPLTCTIHSPCCCNCSLVLLRSSLTTLLCCSKHSQSMQWQAAIKISCAWCFTNCVGSLRCSF